ncbi:putative alpha/beta hydrolase [Arthrobacter stackebrandtii]|uniref:Alpha/beta hydrolase n=1 Tax=Arthrobacter stackebrandtii TaxID=272161 RepID=A0ABS4YSH0_9MICC|nr:alpha/beta fold hydrolase [Arthrobacter stackebrandtii]MBP2411729.1 putative alpha/beta hydrolase [Arthrobacter stackebrandtii]
MGNNVEEMVTAADLTIESRGGGLIRGTLREPADGEPRALVVIHPATAVPERLYLGFSEFLAGQGYAVVTYDYRGTGRSGAPKTFAQVRVRDWMFEDVPDVAEWAAARFPELPRLAIGHSVGAHALALGAGTDGLDGMVAIASHAGVTATVRGVAERAKVRFVLSGAGPLATKVLGYMPGSKLGLGEDFPAAAMLEWSSWSKHRGYFFDDPTMRALEKAASVTGPMLSIGFSDDPWATPQQIEAITDHMTAASVERRTYSPAEFGVPAIGHMGFFRRGLRDGLWPEVVVWLEGKLAEVSPGQVD